MNLFKLDNRGFAITGVVYTVFLLIVFFITFAILNISIKGVYTNKHKKDVQTELNSNGVAGFPNNGVNSPRITQGLTPIKWVNGVEELVIDPINDKWYDYSKKEWANAKTNDGSYWVWIPRYAYSIKSGYHTGNTGEIDIEFLIGTSKTPYSGNVVLENKPTYSGDKQLNYVLHPGFTFGTDELTGFWVAKFEPTGTETSIRILPNVTPFSSNVTIKKAFLISRDLENNAIYGWNNTTVDTHLSKDLEWGAIAYLSKSKYGKENEEIWINSTNPQRTGCAGNSVSSTASAVCNEYNTVIGVRASTTGNITGIYDMVGSSYEYVSAYIKTTDPVLITHFSDVNTVPDKYIDRYPISATNASNDNYELTKNIFGNGVYEVAPPSTSGPVVYAWFSDYMFMPEKTGVFTLRGGEFSSHSNAGIFMIHRINGNISNFTFRPVVVVK